MTGVFACMNSCLRMRVSVREYAQSRATTNAPAGVDAASCFRISHGISELVECGFCVGGMSWCVCLGGVCASWEVVVCVPGCLCCSGVRGAGGGVIAGGAGAWVVVE